VLPREAGTTVRLVLRVYHAHHTGMAEVGKTVCLDVVTDCVYGIIGGDELRARRRIDAIETRVGDRRRADTHVDLLGSRLPDHMPQLFAGRAPYDRIVHHHDTLTFQKTLDGVEFDFHLKMPNSLLRLDKRAPDIVIAD